MNPYTRAALFVIRLVAFGFILLSVLQVGADLFRWKGMNSPVNYVAIFLKSTPSLVGVLLLVKGYPIARKITENFDE